MSLLDDEFDLDIRLTPIGRWPTPLAVEMSDTGGWDCYSVDPSCGATCGCNTNETCNQQLEDCGYPFTYPGNYCEDQSDGCDETSDTCVNCPGPATDGCSDDGCSEHEC